MWSQSLCFHFPPKKTSLPLNTHSPFHEGLALRSSQPRSREEHRGRLESTRLFAVLHGGAQPSDIHGFCRVFFLLGLLVRETKAEPGPIWRATPVGDKPTYQGVLSAPFLDDQNQSEISGISSNQT